MKAAILVGCALLLAYFAAYESAGVMSLTAAIAGTASFALATR